MNVQAKRPVVKIPLSRVEIGLEIVAGLGILFSIFVVIKFWPQLPDTIPTYFGFSGKPYAWESKGTLLILAIVSIGMYTLLALFSWIPKIYNYPIPITDEDKAHFLIGRSTMVWLKAEIIWMSVYWEWVSIQVALGKMDKLDNAIFYAMMAVVFGTAIFHIARLLRVQADGVKR